MQEYDHRRRKNIKENILLEQYWNIVAANFLTSRVFFPFVLINEPALWKFDGKDYAPRPLCKKMRAKQSKISSSGKTEIEVIVYVFFNVHEVT